MKLTCIGTLLALLSSACYAELNGRCNPGGLGDAFGVCVHTAACTNSGGRYTTGDCPNDPTDIKCCFEAQCQGQGSICAWTDQCGGTSSPGFCAGPSNFQCCIFGTDV
ncbi:hypothetical protein K440DRAFT_595590 [Wilcoxina mikolae CBS 423.85]|nr:hypothetical protein K440DRAFT_595590 [Wilcoxina mikolae CBS 423.85]